MGENLSRSQALLAGMIVTVLATGVTGALLRSGEQQAAVSPSHIPSAAPSATAVTSSPSPPAPAPSPAVPAVGSAQPSNRSAPASDAPRSTIRRAPTLPITGTTTSPAAAALLLGSAATIVASLRKPGRDRARRCYTAPDARP
ncbi:MAG: hypothetical protein WDA27_09905 [Actinomycetota bacterium]